METGRQPVRRIGREHEAQQEFRLRSPPHSAGLAGGIAATGAMTLFGPSVHAAKPIKIGYVSPKSGPLAAFAEADDFMLGQFRATIKNGLKLGSETYQIEVIEKDSQSNPNRAAEVAKELITRDNVGLILVGATPETNNPVATQCELEQIPCISSVAPWQTNFIARQANPADPKSWKPFDTTFHYFWGLEDVIGVFTGMWGQVASNKSVGALFPNDGDGNAWGDKVVGFPPVLAKQGFTLTDPGRFQNFTDDFSAQISAFRGAEAEIVTGVVIPPDFTTFWNQSQQKGYKPKVVSVAKALLFPRTVKALGKSGHNISTEVWWTPSHPYKSSLTGICAADLAKGYEQASGKQWTQPIGFVHSLFEVAVDALKRPRIRLTAPPWRRRSVQRNSKPSSVRSSSAPTRCRHSPPRTSRRRRWSAGSGGSTARSTKW